MRYNLQSIVLLHQNVLFFMKKVYLCNLKNQELSSYND